VPCLALCHTLSIVTAASVTALSMIDDRQDALLVETTNAATIDAMSLCEVIIRNKKMRYCKRLAITIARGWSVSRLFQSGGMMTWGIFGVNRYLIMTLESGNRVLIDRCEYRFLVS